MTGTFLGGFRESLWNLPLEMVIDNMILMTLFVTGEKIALSSKTSHAILCDVCGKAMIRHGFLCPIKVNRDQTDSDRPCSDVAAPCTELLCA